MSNQADLQNEFLQSLVWGKTFSSVYLTNGIRLSGHLVAFDTYTVMLESVSGRQLGFKHAISTVMPAQTAGDTVSSRSGKHPVTVSLA